jgi:hypothetical protein
MQYRGYWDGLTTIDSNMDASPGQVDPLQANIARINV